MKRFFKSFEEDEILFKIKVAKGNQKYNSICWYRIEGLWKFSGDILWKSLGIIEEKNTCGKWDHKTEQTETPRLLELAETRFIEQMRNKDLVAGVQKVRRLSTMEAARRIDA